jgi:hypothetical protein
MNDKSSSEVPIIFDHDDLAPYQSAYLHGGRQQESWALNTVRILGDSLETSVDIINPYTSTTDEGGFHLSIFCAQEFCTELILFWTFKKLVLPGKTQEAWMRKCSCKVTRPIRSHLGINVAMTCKSFRMINGMAYAHALFTISDGTGGLFIVEQHGGFKTETSNAQGPR